MEGVDEDDSPISPDQPPAASAFPGPETGTYIELIDPPD